METITITKPFPLPDTKATILIHQNKTLEFITQTQGTVNFEKKFQIELPSDIIEKIIKHCQECESIFYIPIVHKEISLKYPLIWYEGKKKYITSEAEYEVEFNTIPIYNIGESKVIKTENELKEIEFKIIDFPVIIRVIAKPIGKKMPNFLYYDEVVFFFDVAHKVEGVKSELKVN